MTQPTIPQLETWLSPGAGLPPAFGHAPEPVGQRGSRSCLPDAPVRSTSQYLLPAHEGGPPNPFARTGPPPELLAPAEAPQLPRRVRTALGPPHLRYFHPEAHPDGPSLFAASPSVADLCCFSLSGHSPCNLGYLSPSSMPPIDVLSKNLGRFVRPRSSRTCGGVSDPVPPFILCSTTSARSPE